jgi:hypothetical protein
MLVNTRETPMSISPQDANTIIAIYLFVFLLANFAKQLDFWKRALIFVVSAGFTFLLIGTDFFGVQLPQLQAFTTIEKIIVALILGAMFTIIFSLFNPIINSFNRNKTWVSKTIIFLPIIFVLWLLLGFAVETKWLVVEQSIRLPIAFGIAVFVTLLIVSGEFPLSWRNIVLLIACTGIATAVFFWLRENAPLIEPIYLYGIPLLIIVMGLVWGFVRDVLRSLRRWGGYIWNILIFVLVMFLCLGITQLNLPQLNIPNISNNIVNSSPDSTPTLALPAIIVPAIIVPGLVSLVALLAQYLNRLPRQPKESNRFPNIPDIDLDINDNHVVQPTRFTVIVAIGTIKPRKAPNGEILKDYNYPKGTELQIVQISNDERWLRIDKSSPMWVEAQHVQSKYGYVAPTDVKIVEKIIPSRVQDVAGEIIEETYPRTSINGEIAKEKQSSNPMTLSKGAKVSFHARSEDSKWIKLCHNKPLWIDARHIKVQQLDKLPIYAS